MPKDPSVQLELDGFEVAITNPGKLFFARGRASPSSTWCDYYLAVADGALRGVMDRPMALKRFVDGAAGEAFFQKRAPDSVPEFVRDGGAVVSLRAHRRRGGGQQRAPRWPGS